MYFLSLSILSMIGTFVVMLLEYVNTKVINLWNIPLLFICFFFGIILFIVLVILIISIFVKPNKDRPRKIYRAMIVFITGFLCEFYRLDIQLKGVEKIPTTGTYLFVSNHQSNVDPLATLWSLRKFHFTYIMKNGIMKLPLVGRWLHGGGFFPLDRKNNRKAMETIVYATKRLQNQVHSIAVYPEGTRSKGPHINEFRNGVFKVAQKAKAPIVVAILDNTYRVKKRYPFRKTTILLEIIDVLNYQDYQEYSTNELGEMVYKLMDSSLNQRRKQIKALTED